MRTRKQLEEDLEVAKVRIKTDRLADEIRRKAMELIELSDELRLVNEESRRTTREGRSDEPGH